MKKLLLSILLVGAATYANAQKSEIAEAKRLWGIFQFSMMVDPSAPKMKLPQERVKTGPASTGGFGADGKADSKVGRTEAAESRAPKPVGKTAETGGQPKTFIEKQVISLNDGMSHADKAILNEKTKDLVDPYVYKALFSSTIAFVDTVNLDNSLQAQKVAEAAIAKAKALDTKGENKDELKVAELNVRNAITARGLRAYNAKDYASAYNYFTEVLANNPNDTSMYMNAGLTAKLSGKYAEAITNYKKMIAFNVPDAKSYYSEIVMISLVNQKDTAQTLALITEALAKYPDDPEFISTETDIYVRQGNIAKSQELLQKLIAKDATKPVYHFLMGNTYYTQAVALTADRKKLGDKQTKEIDAMNVKIMKMVDLSLPFYKKALELDAKYAPALESLKAIYAFKGDTANYNDVKKRLDEIPVTN